MKHHARRGGELVGAEQRQDGRVGHDGRRARGVRAAVPGRRAGADRVLARRRRRRRAEGDQAHQRPEGQGARDGAVHRGGLLHPLPRAGGRARDQHAARTSRRRPDPDKLNLVYCADAFAAGECSCAT